MTGSARVVSDGPIGGMLRFDHPDFGVAGVGASPPVSDALFLVRRQEGGINTGVALHNLESSPGLLRCDLMREGVLLDAASIPLEANGQTSWLIDQALTGSRRRYVRLRGIGALRCGGGGAVQRRGPGNGLRQPHLRHASGGAGPRDARSGIDARWTWSRWRQGKRNLRAISPAEVVVCSPRGV